jgi:hypothetical protein
MGAAFTADCQIDARHERLDRKSRLTGGALSSEYDSFAMWDCFMKIKLNQGLAVAIAALLAASSSAQSNSAITQTSSVPTMDEWGLIGLIAAVGVAAGVAIRRRGKK